MEWHDSDKFLQECNTTLVRRVGGSIGTTLVEALACAYSLKTLAQCGSIATLLCGAGERYSYFYVKWLREQGLAKMDQATHSKIVSFIWGISERPGSCPSPATAGGRYAKLFITAIMRSAQL